VNLFTHARNPQTVSPPGYRRSPTVTTNNLGVTVKNIVVALVIVVLLGAFFM
jgi:hypothetical protein